MKKSGRTTGSVRCSYVFALQQKGIVKCMMTPARPRRSYRRVETWAMVIGRCLDKFVDVILILAESVLAALRELRPHYPRARYLLQARTRLSQPMVSKLEAIGRHAALMRPKAMRSLPSRSSFYILSQKPARQYLRTVEIDLRWMSYAKIRQLCADDEQPCTPRKLFLKEPDA